jgi:hypothetical protein
VALSGLYGLWFLQGGQQGWKLLPIAQGTVPLENAYFPLSKAATPNQQTAPAQNASAVSDAIGLELSNAIEHYADLSQLQNLALGLLRLGDTPTTIAIYQTLGNSSDPEIRLIGLTGSIRAQDHAALAKFVADIDSASGLKMSNVTLNAIASIRDGSLPAVQALGKMALSSGNMGTACVFLCSFLIE